MFLDHEISKEKILYLRRGNTRVDETLRKFEPTTGASKTRLRKKPANYELYEITRKPL